MTDRPIIFSAPMVRALFDGRKTQTRRVLKHKSIEVGIAPRVEVDHPEWIQFLHPQGGPLTCVKWPYAPGDRLWVQEDWRTVSSLDRDTPAQMRDMAIEAGYRRAWAPVEYLADGARDNWESGDDAGRRRWSRHMIRELSRLTLRVTDVRVQRVQDISYGDTRAEGVEATDIWKRRQAACLDRNEECGSVCRDSFRDLWNSLHGPGAWDANPWVAAITFDVKRGNIDWLDT